MTTPPFVANHPDGMRCMLACYRMVMQWFLGRDMTWEQMAAFTGYKSGVTAWTLRSLVQFSRMGFDIQMVEPFDYSRYGHEGDTYLEDFFEPDELIWFNTHSDLAGMKPYIDDFLHTVHFTRRSPQLVDIDAMLADGRLVTVTLNSRVLNQKTGFASHMVLLYGKVDGDYLAQDPGPKPKPQRRIAPDLLWQAMGGDGNRNDVTGFKLKQFRNMRLDQWVTKLIPQLSRSYAATLITSGKVTVNAQPQTKPGYKLRHGDSVAVDYDTAELSTIPDISLPVVYEDENCVVINKPVGVLVHSKGTLKPEATVATWLRARVGVQPASVAGTDRTIQTIHNQISQRAGIVHRLDRATSGLMICAKTPAALSYLQQQFAARTVQKTYYAVVQGNMKPSDALIDMPIERNPKAPATFRVGRQGKPAQTIYATKQFNQTHSLLQLTPTTGRTHQLRVHLAHCGHPIVGDVLYNGQPASRLFLHAAELTIRMPGSGLLKTFRAPIPTEFLEAVS